MTSPLETLPDPIYLCAAIPDDADENYEIDPEEGLTLVSLTDAENQGFIPIFSEEPKLIAWVQDFQVNVISVSIPKDTVVALAKDSECNYLVLDLVPGQEQFPIEQVFEVA